MQIREDDNGVTIRIERPEGMTLERFTVLVARLEKIMDELGGSLHVKHK